MKRHLLLIALAAFASTALADMRITFIDAGQADASVVQIEQDSGEPFTIVIDGGDGDSDLRDHLPNLMSSDSIVELLVLSHPHTDHIEALDWLLLQSNISVERAWWGGEQHAIGGFDRFRQAVDAKELSLVRPAETLHLFEGFDNFAIRVFNNGMEFTGTEGHDFNNDSIVFHLVFEPEPGLEVIALFTGDIEEDQGQMLVEQFGDELKSDIVKIPHHGSDHLFEDFPSTVAAEFAIVSSSGTHGTFKHPRKATLDLYEAHGEVFCTCDEALELHHITVIADEDGDISVIPEQPPYLVWERDSNGELQRITVTP